MSILCRLDKTLKYRNQDEGGDLFSFIEHQKKAKASQRSTGLAGSLRSSIGGLSKRPERYTWLWARPETRQKQAGDRLKSDNHATTGALTNFWTCPGVY